MRLFCPDLELRLIRTLCLGKVSGRVLPRVTEDLFHTRCGRRCHAKIADRARDGERPPSWENLGLDPTLDPNLRKELRAFTPGPFASVDEVNDAVRNLSGFAGMRLLVKSAKDIMDAADADDMDVDALARSLEERIYRTRRLAHSGAGWLRHGDVSDPDTLKDMIRHFSREDSRGLKSTFDVWDRANPAGLQRGTLMVMAAPAGHGKSTLALNMARRQAERGTRVLFLQLEMNRSQVYSSFAAAVVRSDSVAGADLPSSRLAACRKELADSDIAAIVESCSRWQESVRRLGGRLDFRYARDAVPGFTETAVASFRECHGAPPDIVYIDYMDRLLGNARGSENPHIALTGMAESLRTFALRNDMVAVLLAQLHKESSKGDRATLRTATGPMLTADLSWTWELKGNDRKDGRVRIHMEKSRAPYTAVNGMELLVRPEYDLVDNAAARESHDDTEAPDPGAEMPSGNGPKVDYGVLSRECEGGRSQKEVAKKHGVSVSTVKRAVARARRDGTNGKEERRSPATEKPEPDAERTTDRPERHSTPGGNLPHNDPPDPYGYPDHDDPLDEDDQPDPLDVPDYDD